MLYWLLITAPMNGQELAAIRSRSVRPCSMATASETAEMKIADRAKAMSS